MTLLNWLLGIAAALMWGGVFIYYFRDMIYQAWVARNDKWFRQD